MTGYRHGHWTAAGRSPTYMSWTAMKSRCDNPARNNYHNYGGRGISYDPRWAVFDNFLADMGERPRGKTLERKDNNKNYCKENCEWRTHKEQHRNKRTNALITYQGQTLTLIEWSEKLNISYSTLTTRRAKYGSNPEKLFAPRLPRGRGVVYQGSHK